MRRMWGPSSCVAHKVPGTQEERRGKGGGEVVGFSKLAVDAATSYWRGLTDIAN